jgi:DNA (cytosine-5)-methyltransferase 1
MIAMELFSCSGGLAEGFRRAGITFQHVVDWDKDACTSYEANLGHRPYRMDVRDLLRMAETGWSPGHLDLLVADPPCTQWSTAGKRKGLLDERDTLLPTIALIRLLRPRAFLIGNVPGLELHLDLVGKLFAPLREVGYCTADFFTLDAADYGVPQHRVRPFWFGHLSGDCLTIPPRTHCDPQGFPDGWIFAGKTKKARWGQIGMAMPPALAEAVARQVVKHFASTDKTRTLTHYAEDS